MSEARADDVPAVVDLLVPTGVVRRGLKTGQPIRSASDTMIPSGPRT
jgi:hypothetical protein